jgi:hypothetical protein
VVNSTSITATTPVGTAGAKDVVVTTSNGSGTLSGGFIFVAPQQPPPPPPPPEPTPTSPPTPTPTPTPTPSTPAVQAPALHTLNVNILGKSSGVQLDSQGAINQDVLVLSQDGSVEVKINKNTLIQNNGNLALDEIKILTTGNVLNIPDGTVLLDAYECSPGGTVFTPFLILTIKYKALPANVDENKIYIALWNGTEWQKLAGFVDTEKKTVTISVAHFSTYALFAPYISSQSAIPTLTTTASQPTISVPAQLPQTSSPTPEVPKPPVSSWLIGVIFGISAVATTGILLTIRSRRKV